MSALDRERVLRYPDLAERLTKPPLNYANPRQWSGFIPPDTYGQALNLSPEREALMELANEAYRREQEGWTPPTHNPPEQDSDDRTDDR